MLAVLINTYRHSKFAYIYTLATLLFISPLFTIAYEVLLNWYNWCYYYPDINPKCPADPSMDYFNNIWLMLHICSDMSYCLYHQAHFLFAYRYFEVAEMFGRKDKTMHNHIKVRKVTSKISYVVIGLIAINYLLHIAMWIYWRINGQFSYKIYTWTYLYIPSLFLTADCVLLLIGLVWICRSLKHDPQVMGNEKWMCLHTILLSITLGAFIFYNLSGYSLLSTQINVVCNSVVYLLMGLIMNQVNYPEKMVWAHLKLDTYDKEEILPYLKSSTVNE